jgi:hypothetical protein
MQDIAREMYQIVFDATARLGLSAEDRDAAIRRAREGNEQSKPSEATMARFNLYCDILNLWRGDKRYRDNAGNPCTLQIKGRGRSLQALARRCLPGIPVEEIAEALLQCGEVIRYKDDKVALVGGTVVIVPRTAELMLSVIASRFRHLAATILHNSTIPLEIKGTGRFERVTSGLMTEKAFRQYSEEIRPLLQSAAERAEAGLMRPDGTTMIGKGKLSGVGFYMFREDGAAG